MIKSKITKKLKTKFNYRPLTSVYSHKDNNYDILNLSLNFNSENFATEIYESKKKKLNFESALNTAHLTML